MNELIEQFAEESGLATWDEKKMVYVVKIQQN